MESVPVMLLPEVIGLLESLLGAGERMPVPGRTAAGELGALRT
jgi:hypothetical protein